MSAVIHAESLSKRYHRGALSSSTLLRDSLARVVKSPLSIFRRSRQEPFWALKDASLEVGQGEVLGLIGRNGAGKTTLLKILSRITRPTSGWAEIRGRVGSLLEVGTGFHPELTGRENTFLSGAILGMRKREITRKFDEIVSFAELEDFIDTSVKHYSSGMYVRLAFAVAAHLEPEILLVDEVLAVGDIKFQKKCLGKMGDVARAGRTVVLVSHQLNQIRRLCHRVVWIDGGKIIQSGGATQVVGAYETAMASGDRTMDETGRAPATTARFVKWELEANGLQEQHSLNTLDPVSIRISISLLKPIKSGLHGIALYNHDHQLIWAREFAGLNMEPGDYQFRHQFPFLPLRPGYYSWLVSIYNDGHLADMWYCVPEMIVVTENHQSSRDEWNGPLNLPDQLQIVNQVAPGNLANRNSE